MAKEIKLETNAARNENERIAMEVAEIIAEK